MCVNKNCTLCVVACDVIACGMWWTLLKRFPFPEQENKIVE